MIIDSCAYIGHYPFRKTSVKSAEELIALMDEHGIDKAVVSSIQGVYYKDMMDGNLELFEEIKPYVDRLIPAANINPCYPCAMEDLERCVKEFGCREIRLWPRQTGKDVNCDEYVNIIKRCGELGVPVAFCIEDVRGGHNLDIENCISTDELVEVATYAPHTDIVVHNPMFFGFMRPLYEVERKGNIYFDMGKLDSLYFTPLIDAVETVGFDHIMFGSSAPLQYIGPHLVKLKYLGEKLGASKEDMDKIYFENAKKLYE